MSFVAATMGSFCKFCTSASGYITFITFWKMELEVHVIDAYAHDEDVNQVNVDGSPKILSWLTNCTPK